MSKHVARFRVFDNVGIGRAGHSHSDAIINRMTTGFAALRVKFTSAGAATVTITQEVSMDGEIWYSAVDTSGTALSTIYTNLAKDSDTWIVFSPQLAPYIRITVTEDDVAALTALYGDLMFQEDLV